jgi:hypothetical protein
MGCPILIWTGKFYKEPLIFTIQITNNINKQLLEIYVRTSFMGYYTCIYIYIYCGFDFLPLRQLYKFQATNVHKYVVLGIAILE